MKLKFDILLAVLNAIWELGKLLKSACSFKQTLYQEAWTSKSLIFKGTWKPSKELSLKTRGKCNEWDKVGNFLVWYISFGVKCNRWECKC